MCTLISRAVEETAHQGTVPPSHELTVSVVLMMEPNTRASMKVMW